MTDICPYARGFDPHRLTCDLTVAADARLPWWRRVARAIAGWHDCPHPYGKLQIGVTGHPIPCERFGLARQGGQDMTVQQSTEYLRTPSWMMSGRHG